MSQKTNLHYKDFCELYSNELKRLFQKRFVQPKLYLDTQKGSFDPNEFCEHMINGTGGFKCMESREWAVFPDRDVAIVAFTIRALANTRCEGSEEMLQAIIEHRNKKETADSPA